MNVDIDTIGKILFTIGIIIITLVIVIGSFCIHWAFGLIILGLVFVIAGGIIIKE